MMNTMIRTIISAAALVASVAASFVSANAQSAEPGKPVLKSHVTINGGIVRIGDLIDNAGVVANIAVFRAPDLGTTGTVPVAAIIEAVRPHALVGFDTGGANEVVVTRASREIAMSDIERSIAAQIVSRFGAGPVADLTVTFDREPRAIQVDANAQGDVTVGRLTYDARNARFDATLEIPAGGAQKSILRLAGRAVSTTEVVVMARNVDRGGVVKAADLVVERRPRSEVGRDGVASLDHAVGMAARNVLRSGQPLRTADLTKPQLVQRGEMVTLVFEAPGLTLTMRGKANEGGTEGDTISVLNEQSKRTVQGAIVGPGHVVVRSGVPRLAANIPVQSDDGSKP